MSEEEKQAIEYYKEYKTIMNNEIVLTGHIKTLKVDYKKLETLLNYIDKLQKKEEQSQQILRSLWIIYRVHTKDCELVLKDIKKWEKILDK